MTNFEKYKTAEERAKAFYKWIDGGPMITVVRAFRWLEQEAEEEKPLPCPFCGRTTSVGSCLEDPDKVYVTCTWCDYRSMPCNTSEEAIVAHNRVSKAVMDAKAKEVEK